MLNAALVLEGGSMRGLFTCGVLDVFMENEMWFSYVNGVSAGALNAYSYISRQMGRSAQIPFDYVNDSRYVGFKNLMFHGGIFNFDFLFNEIGRKLSPLDFETFNASGQIFECVATQCESGRAAYFRKGECDEETFERATRASGSMPLLSRSVMIHAKHYLDGGIALPVAYERAFDLGYEKVVLVLTRQQGYRKPAENALTARMMDCKYAAYPELRKTIHRVPAHYNEIQQRIDQLQAQGRLFVIRPEAPVAVGRLEKDVDKLKALYRDGRRIAEKQLSDLREYLK